MCLEQGIGMGTAKHDTLRASLEPDQEEEAERLNSGNKAVDNNAADLSNNMECAAAVQVLQLIQKKVQGDPRHQSFSQGKPSTPGTLTAAPYSPRTALTLPRSSPPPRP